MRLFITGDVHADIELEKFNSKRFPAGKMLSKDDVVLVAGDLGAVWDGARQDAYLHTWYEERPWTTCSIDGNHENHDLLEKLPEVPFCGGIARRINDSLFYLKRGEIYTFCGKKVFVFGGGVSVDKGTRIEGKSWWAQEIPTEDEFESSMENLRKHDYTVDIVVTHTAPQSAIDMLIGRDIMSIGYYRKKAKDKTVEYLSRLEYKVKRKSWYFGHFHKDFSLLNGYTAIYQNVEEIRSNPTDSRDEEERSQ